MRNTLSSPSHLQQGQAASCRPSPPWREWREWWDLVTQIWLKGQSKKMLPGKFYHETMDVITPPETSSKKHLKMDVVGIWSFPFGYYWPIFRRVKAVSFREGIENLVISIPIFAYRRVTQEQLVFLWVWFSCQEADRDFFLEPIGMKDCSWMLKLQSCKINPQAESGKFDQVKYHPEKFFLQRNLKKQLL